MLHEFLSANELDLIERCKVKVLLRSAPRTSDPELRRGIPAFLRQLIETLKLEQGAEPMQSRKISGQADGAKPNFSEIAVTAAQHGRDLLGHGFTIDQVVHDYGDLCQAITDLAFERNETIETNEFRTLNRCLDNAIADAVKEYAYQREAVIAGQTDQSNVLREGILAHELRNHIMTATFALNAIKAGKVGLAGATGAILDRSLVAMSTLIDRSLSEVRAAGEVIVQNQLFSVAEFISEVRLSATLEAHARQCVLTVAAVDPKLAVDADRALLASALANLLQNAFKFTHAKSEVTLNAYAGAERILIEVEDHCGGLPPGEAEKMFAPFTQGGADQSGLGLGLSIARQSIEANKGKLSVRDKPGSGCVFTIDLPRHVLPERRSASKVPA
jgi:signal transduction histidine kinase